MKLSPKLENKAIKWRAMAFFFFFAFLLSHSRFVRSLFIVMHVYLCTKCYCKMIINGSGIGQFSIKISAIMLNAFINIWHSVWRIAILFYFNGSSINNIINIIVNNIVNVITWYRLLRKHFNNFVQYLYLLCQLFR